MFQPFIQTLTLRCTMSVPPAVRDEPSLHLEFNKRDDVDGTRAKLNARTLVGDRCVRKQCALEVRRPRTLVLMAEGGCRDTPHKCGCLSVFVARDTSPKPTRWLKTAS